MPELHESISGVVALDPKDYNEKDYWLAEYLPPSIVADEIKAFINKPIPKELKLYKGFGINDIIIELFVIDGTTHYKEYMRSQREVTQRQMFEINKAKGIIALDAKFVYKEEEESEQERKARGTVIIDPSGESNTKWMTLPFAKVLAMGVADKEFNPHDVKTGDIIRLPDSMVWKAENPVYQQYINHPEYNMKGAKQITKPPMQWIYSAFNSQGMARDAFNINPLNYKNHGFIYKKKVTEVTAVLDVENLLKYTEL